MKSIFDFNNNKNSPAYNYVDRHMARISKSKLVLKVIWILLLIGLQIVMVFGAMSLLVDFLDLSTLNYRGCD